MPKFYVKSGQIKFVIDASDHTVAILAALRKYKGRGLMLGPKICISEKGFESFKDWICYEADDFLKKL